MEEQTPLVLESCYKRSDCTIRIHFHNACELLFVRRGSISIRIDDNVYSAGPGDLMVIGRFEEHSLEVRTEEYERNYVILDPTRLEHLIGDRRLLFPLRNRPKGFCHRFDLSAYFDRVCMIFDTLSAETAAPGAFTEQLCLSLVTELLVYLQRTPSAMQTVKQIPSAVLAVQSYIESHFAEPLSISDLAARVFMTPCYLTHRFKDATGYSPKQYLVLHRVAYAKELLAESSLPVAEVAYRAGFTDVNNFIRTFKRDAGRTPLRYREEQTQV